MDTLNTPGKVKMKTRMMRKVAVLVTGSALALSFPVAGSIAQPSDGNNGKACPHKGSQGKGPKKDKSDLPSQAQGKGLKCGFEKGANNAD